jgi:hypothetical protein
MESKVAKNTSNYRLLSISLLSNSVCIKAVLQQQILASIALSSRSLAVPDLPSNTPRRQELIPLNRLPDDTTVLYRSAIALKLAPLWQLPALNLAHQLADCLATIHQDTSSQVSLDFRVEVCFSGWIHFYLSDQSLANWLQQLIHIPALPSDWQDNLLLGLPTKEIKNQSLEKLAITRSAQLVKRLQNPSHLFKVQYAHARCCSLLRLAHRQGLLQLSDSECNARNWQIFEPNPIPWLNDHPEVEMGSKRLRLEHWAEWALIHQILDGFDQIYLLDSVSALKLANSLSKAFATFYSTCRIWGEVKTETPKLAQARLGLVGVTQKLLRSLLEDQLGETAPREL